jgi:hypothetical protein
MSHAADASSPSPSPSPSAPPLHEVARSLLQWLSCNNPFYVLSAAMFLIGLWASFQAQSGEIETWTLMGSLAGYTLLLAVTAILLVRFAKAWDDLRTVLLVVVLMFLATSVTFDEVLVISPARGFACYRIGLAFTMLVSEGILRGIRLALPALYRVPYYLILGLFFLYPLALNPLVHQPHSEALLWGLFAFSPVAGLLFLTLLPAIRREPDYVENNGSPWHWPLYPWVLFGVLALAVVARSYLLCWSMHLLPGSDRERLIFGPYFLVPFGLAICVLLLEIGIVGKRPGVLGAALAAPLGLFVLSLLGVRHDPIYNEFLDLFRARLGGHPIYLTVVAAAGFYLYAALRGVPWATEALTAALVALAIVGVRTGEPGADGPMLWAPLLATVALQLAIGLWRRAAWRCLLAAEGLTALVAVLLPEDIAAPQRAAIVFHLALLGVLIVGAAFRDETGRLLRDAAAALVLLACVLAVFGLMFQPGPIPPWAVLVYPLVMAAMLASYGTFLGHRMSVAVAPLVVVCWVARVAWWGYFVARQVVVGLDHIALSMLLFALAVFISLGKSGLLKQWKAAWAPANGGAREPNQTTP